MNRGDVGGDLPEKNEQASPHGAPRKQRWKRWLLLIPVLLVLALLWLSGPGLRLFAPRVAQRFLEQAGLKGEFEVEGGLFGGLSAKDLVLEGEGALARLTIDRVIPDYNWAGLRRGELEGLTIEGLHVDLRLGLKKVDKEKPPLDLQKLTQTLRTTRARLIPMDVTVKDATVSATRDDEPFFSLGSSAITHEAGSPELALDLGAITGPDGSEWPAQASRLVWEEGEMRVERLDPYPGVSLRDLVVTTPEGGALSVETGLVVGEAVFAISTGEGISSAKIDMTEGSLELGETAARFGAEIPAKGTVTSLAAEVDQLMPEPKDATGSARLLLEDVVWDDWTADELNVDVTLGADQLTFAARGTALGTEVSASAAAPVKRGGEEGFELGDMEGEFAAAEVPEMMRRKMAGVPAEDETKDAAEVVEEAVEDAADVVEDAAEETPAKVPVEDAAEELPLMRQAAPKVPVIEAEAAGPQPELSGKFRITFDKNKPTSVDADIVLQPKEPGEAAPVTVKGGWNKEGPLKTEIDLEGLNATLTYEPTTGAYEGEATFDEFTSERVQRWLDLGKVDIGGVVTATGKWSGSGNVKEGTHTGAASLQQATWTRPEEEAITAIGDVKYDWPESFSTSGLRVGMGDQSIAVKAELAENLLVVEDFLWKTGDRELADGNARLPVPEDFASWREMLANDARPISFSLNSRVLALELLEPWVPALDQVDPDSTGQLQLNISGTFADPVVEAMLELRDLGSPAQPDLPPADVKLEVTGRDERLALKGTITAPDFPPAELSATMPFRPAAWAQDPDELWEAPVEGRLDLPRLDISRFGALVPAVEELEGVVTGNAVISGTVGEPVIEGELDLTNAAVELESENLPDIRGLSASIDLATNRIVLENIEATVEGGTITGAGSVAITEGALGEIDLRLTADHLPLKRDDMMIVRASAQLRLQGTLEQARLTGNVGIVDSLFYKDIEILPMGSPFTGPSAASLPALDKPRDPAALVPEAIAGWGLDVTVRTTDPILLRGNLADGYIVGSIQVGGTFANPAPRGTLTIRDFEASLPFSTLSIRSGTATFTPETGFDPILEIRGTAEPRPYRVSAYVYGRASDPELVLTSNPPLPDNEIMTLLATGTTTAGLEDPQAASSRALQFLIEELRRGRFRFGKQLRPLLAALDDVDFSLAEEDPYSTDAFTTATLSITDRWFLSAGIGETGDSRILAVWRLTFR